MASVYSSFVEFGKIHKYGKNEDEGKGFLYNRYFLKGVSVAPGQFLGGERSLLRVELDEFSVKPDEPNPSSHVSSHYKEIHHPDILTKIFTKFISKIQYFLLNFTKYLRLVN